MPCAWCNKKYQKRRSQIQMRNQKIDDSYHEEYYESTIISFRGEFEVVISGPRRLNIDAFDL